MSIFDEEPSEERGGVIGADDGDPEDESEEGEHEGETEYGVGSEEVGAALPAEAWSFGLALDYAGGDFGCSGIDCFGDEVVEIGG